MMIVEMKIILIEVIKRNSMIVYFDNVRFDISLNDQLDHLFFHLDHILFLIIKIVISTIQ